MSYAATVFNVLIASPGDVAIERDFAQEVVQDWNAANSRSRKIVLQPIRWETHSHPMMGDRAQGILNEQILKDADLVVAIFWTRLGTPTGVAPGGSVEELQRHMAEGKPTMVYFSDVHAPLDSGASPGYQALVRFRDDWCKPRGLLNSYKSHDEFKEKFRQHLTTKLNDDSYFVLDDMPAASPVANPSFLEIADRLKRGESLDYIGVVPDLSPEAKTLLLEAATDANGTITYVRMMSGPALQTNGKNFIEDNDPRSAASWEGALEELRQYRMIKDRGSKGQVFQLTREGYQAADFIRSQSQASAAKMVVPADGQVTKLSLSADAKTLLTEASVDTEGLIIYGTKGGTVIINTNRKDFIHPKYPRSRSQWEHALKELIDSNLVRAVDEAGERLELTQEGRELVEQLRP